MATGSKIEWTDATWTCITGCTRASAGCDHCYSARMTYRLEMMGQEKYTGLTVLNPRGERHFNGVVKCHDDELMTPLRWKKPRRIFVNSMSDTFHKDVPFEFIDKMFAVMALCPQHTFQVLTKRPERMAEYLNRSSGDLASGESGWLDAINRAAMAMVNRPVFPTQSLGMIPHPGWPLPNCWLGTSVENQPAADERIPHLLRCPASVRFLSVEPMIGPVDLREINLPVPAAQKTLIVHPNLVPMWEKAGLPTHADLNEPIRPIHGHSKSLDALGKIVTKENGVGFGMDTGIDWCIVGGESGHGARPCNIEWIRSIIAQCKAASVPCFVKQLGAKPYCKKAECLDCNGTGFFDPDDTTGPKCDSCDGMGTADGHLDDVLSHRIKDPKGGDWNEWPEDLRVREFPKASVTA